VAAGPVFSQAAAVTQQPGVIFLSVISGVYAQDQLLRAEQVGPQISLRYSIRDPDGAEGSWVPFREALRLTAAAGEEREYRIIVRADSDAGEIERREVWIRIDKKPPAPPHVSPEPGTYWDPVGVVFDKGVGDTVFYAVSGNVIAAPAAWDGKTLTIGTQDARSDFVVQAYSVDAAGNRSAIVTARYTVDARSPQLDVLSPVSGTFANAQVLALSFRNVQWVRYTLDGTDPAAGTPYAGPVPLPKQGVTTVKVAAQPRSARRALLRRDVSVTYAPERGTGLRLDLESGTYAKAISPHVLSAPEGSVYYTLWEKSPSESDFLAGTSISLPSDPSVPRALTLRFRALSSGGTWGGEYRYFFFVGQTGPSAPLITVGDAEPIRTLSHAQVIAPEDALVSVTTDGSRPNPLSPSSSGLLDVKPGSAAGALTVKAVAIDGSGSLSPVTQRSIVLDPSLGAAPSLRASVSTRSGTAIFSGPAAQQGMVYEITSDGAEPAAPTAGSARLDLPLSLSVPFGMQRTFKVRAAYLDANGRIMAVGDAISATVDRKPPSRPLLSPAPSVTPLDEPTTVTISSPAGVYTTLSSDGATPADPGADAPASVKSLSLAGVDGALTTYRVKLLAIDAAGNASEVYGPILYSVDLRPPRIPAISGIADRGRYNKRQVSIGMADSAWNVRYTMTTDGSAPPDPDATSPLLTKDTTFTGDDGGVVTFRMKLLAISHNSTRLGERREISFAIDLKTPDVPLVAGAAKGGRVSRPLTLTADPLPADVTLFYSVSATDADPPDPVTAGERYAGPIVFDAPDGARRDFIVRFATQDDAGNRSPYDRRYQFSVDRELPDDPVMSGAPQGGVSARPVSISLSAANAAIVYELTDDGATPKVPTAASSAYSSPLLLTGRVGASVTYHLLSRAINDLGNMSRASTIVTVVVDRTVPPAAPSPHVTYVPESPEVAFIAWDKPADVKLLYRLTGSPAAAASFVLYGSPLAVTLSSVDGGALRGEAVLENDAGTRGAVTGFVVAAAKRMAVPVMRGVRDNGMYTGRVEIAFDAQPGAQIRYEISTDGEFPPAVTSSSPIVSSPLVVDAADGQTLEVRMAARAFDPSGSALVSEESHIGFTIDRTPPDPPVATGIEDGGYYQDARDAVLLSAEGVIYYSLSTGKDAAIPSQSDASRYTGDIQLKATPGQTMTYRITAFSVDAAGNRSREIRTWTVTIDQKIVYMSPDGNDYADGARGSPVRSLEKALKIASTTSRTTIYAAAGVYPTDSELSIATDVSIVGGLDPVSWTPLGFERWSTISSADHWRGGTSLLSLTGGTVSLKGVEITDATGSLPSLVSLQGGELDIAGSLVSLRGSASARGIVMSAGTLAVATSVLRADGVRQGSLIAATRGKLSIEGTELDGPRDGTDFACLDLSNLSFATLKGITVAPGSGQRTRGLRLTGTQVSISGSRIVSGAGSIDAIAIDATGSVLTLESTDLAAVSGARSPIALLSVDSSSNVAHCTFSVAGASSAVGVSVRGGSITILRSTIRGSATPEYLALVKVEDAKALLANNILKGAEAGQSICVLAKGGAVDILNNTILGGTGTTFTTGVMVQGATHPRIVNNIIVRAENGRGVAILFAGAGAQPFVSTNDGPQILTNSFAGWQNLLTIDHAPEVALSSANLSGIEALNSADGDAFGGPVSGNIVETASQSFRPGKADDYHLSRTSKCLDAGTDLTGVLGNTLSSMVPDMDGNPRPAQSQLVTPGPARGWDIGAYEYSE
jgi:hypothetical protein